MQLPPCTGEVVRLREWRHRSRGAAHFLRMMSGCVSTARATARAISAGSTAACPSSACRVTALHRSSPVPACGTLRPGLDIPYWNRLHPGLVVPRLTAHCSCTARFRPLRQANDEGDPGIGGMSTPRSRTPIRRPQVRRRAEAWSGQVSHDGWQELHNHRPWTAPSVRLNWTAEWEGVALVGGSPARRAASLCISPGAGLGNPSSLAPWPGCEPFHSRPDGQAATDPTSPQTRATPVRERSLLRILSPSRASQLPQTAIGTLCGD